MTKQKKSEPGDGTVDPLATRLRDARDRIWRGNASRMAADLGVNQSTLSRVLAAATPASGALLLALAARPDVDPGWLLTGSPARRHELRVPFARALLPEAPGRCPDLLAPGWLTLGDFPDAEDGEAYAYRVRPDDPFANRTELGLLPGDCLFVLADPTVAVRVARRPGSLLVAAVPQADPDPATRRNSRARLARVLPGARAEVYDPDPAAYALRFPDFGPLGRRKYEDALFRLERLDTPVGGEPDVGAPVVAGACLQVVRWFDPRLAPWIDSAGG